MKSIREEDITPIELYQMFRRRLRMFWWIVAASLAMAIILCIVSTRRYEARGTIQIAKEASDALGLESLMGAMSGTDAGDALQGNINIETQANILQSETLALQTIHDTNLEHSYDFQPRFNLIGRLTYWTEPSSHKDPPHAPLEDSPQKRRQVLNVFSKQLKVKPVSGTRLIEIRYLNSDPKVAADVVNHLMQGLIEYTFRTRYDATAKASEWLSAQMQGLRKNSEDLQAKVVQMQKESGVYSIGTTDAAGREQAYSGVLDRLQQDTVALSAAIQNRVLKGAIYEAARSGDGEMLSGLAGNSISTGVSPGTSNSLMVIQNLRTQQAALSAQIQQDNVKFGRSFPKLEEEKANAAALEKAIHEESQRLADRAKSDYDIALSTETSTRAEYDAQKASADLLNDKAIKYVIAREEALDSRHLYEDLMKRLNEAGVLQGLQSTNITVVDKGSIPARPKWPNIPLFLLAGLGFGICCGGACIIIVDRLDNKLQEPSEIERLGVPLFGLLPMLGQASKAPGKMQMLDAPRSAFSESIRKVCEALMLSQSGEPPKVILVTSAIPDEGKSTLSAGIAAAFAQQGKRVLLVEVDMRRPTLGRRIGTSDPEGLSSLLSSGTEGAHAPRPINSAIPNLFFLSSGPLPPYPAELLGSERMKELLRMWRKMYDIIVLDGPPVLPVVDALILCGMSDTTIQVARHNFTSRTSLIRAHQELEERTKKSIGVVLNAVSSGSEAYYGYKQSKHYGSYEDYEKA